MFKLIKATAIVSIVTIATVLVGIVRAKFTAVTLGPAGVGIFSQATNFQQLLITISSLSIGLGIAKYVAKYKAEGDAASVENVISCAILMQLAVFLLLTLFIILFSGRLSVFLFSDAGYSGYILISSVATLFPIWAGTIEATMFGAGDYRAFARGRSISSLLSLVPLFFFIMTMGIKGSFPYLALNGLVTFAVYYYIFRRSMGYNAPYFNLNPAKIAAIKGLFLRFGKELILYGGASFLMGMLGMGNILLLRSFIIKYFGAGANGYYQVVFTLSAYYIAFFTNGLWSYLYAKISSTKDEEKYSIELNHAMRFCIFGIVPVMSGLFLLRHVVINILFTSKFASSSELFATQLFGDMFFILTYVLGTSLLASTRLKAYIIFGFAYSVFFIGLFLLLHNILGLKAITVSYLISNILYFTGLAYYHMKTMSLKIYNRNTRLFLSATVLCIAIFFFGGDGIFSFLIKVILVAGWLVLLATKQEKRKAIAIIRSRLKLMPAAGYER